MPSNPVTQADRDAVKQHQQRFLTEGESETVLLLQAFARHRAAGMEQAAVIAEEAMVLLSLGTPGEGPFTRQDRAVDEARAAIATAIRQAIGADK